MWINPNICVWIWIGFWIYKMQHLNFLLILCIHDKIIYLMKTNTDIKYTKIGLIQCIRLKTNKQQDNAIYNANKKWITIKIYICDLVQF